MNNNLKLFYIITFIALATGFGDAADVRSLIEFRDNSTIDWTRGVVAARGIGDPTTYSYYKKSQEQRQKTIADAMNKARHNLLETIVGIRINTENRVIDIVENYPSIMNQLREMTYQAPEVENLRRYLFDGTVEVWSQMKLNGGFTQLILPPEIRQIESIKQVRPGKNSTQPQTSARSSQIYTGMVVDARGIQAIPVVAPRILDENLEEVFGPTYASREFAVQKGVARYATNIWQAKFDLRVSDNPIVVKALKTIWPRRCDFIISNSDADKLRSASEHLLFLRECRVIIVLDPM
ncbi:hypothetical protein D1BOALGB6SA_286 [Olavius sp. associated proteobacterium Delta 1]|nr:hypothetical protein D1BOALGB6SA_286 [Olavius sp. associated proteobacterium Delta 1]